MIKHNFLISIATALVALTGVISLSAQSLASHPMTLRECMEYAIANSTRLRIQQAETGDAQIARRDAVLKAFTPTVDGSSYAYYNFGRAIDPQTNTYTGTTSFHNGYSLSAGITLFDGFEAVNNLKISRTSLAMGYSQQEQAEADICLATMEAYYNAQFYSEMASIYEAQVETAQASVYLARKQEELGTKGHADVVQMEAELADRQHNLTRTRNMLADAMMTLQDVMFWPLDSALVLAPVPCEPVEAQLTATDDVVSSALAINPGLKIALGNMQNAQLRLSTARWQTLPSLGLYAGWSTTYFNYPGGGTVVDPFRTQFKANGGEYVQLSLSIPIYDRLARRSEISRRRNALARATAEYDQKTREVASEVRRAIADCDGAFAAFEAAERKVAAQEEAYRLNVKKFEQGLISPIEFQTATNSYLSAQADRLDALFKFNIKASVVRYYNGERYIEQ